jgi:hypothetical protein
VSKARLILFGLICASPLMLLMEGPLLHGLLAGVLGIALGIVARALRPGETEFLLSFISPVVAVAAVPALWILVQVMPLAALAHPIWASAQAAVAHPLTGSISIDTGASVMALGRYLSIVAAGLVAAAVGVDRQRAEWIRSAVIGATAAIGLIVIAAAAFGPRLAFDHAQAGNAAIIGLIVAAAALVALFEQSRIRGAGGSRSQSHPLRSLAAGGSAFCLCAVAAALDASRPEIMAAGYGLAVLLAVAAVRGLGFGPWGAGAVAAGAALIAVALIAGSAAPRGASLLLGFAAAAPERAISSAQRMLDDTPSGGTGAGTFAAVAPIYRDVDDPDAAPAAPTAAATLAIELGHPMLALIAAATAGAILALLRASLRRGRDWFYPAAGAATLTSLSLLSLMNAGMLGTAAALLAAAVLGLAFAQSRSRMPVNP